MTQAELTRNIQIIPVKQDANGNRRVVFHYIVLADTYAEATKLAHKLGARKYDYKSFRGGFVIQEDNDDLLRRRIYELRTTGGFTK